MIGMWLTETIWSTYSYKEEMSMHFKLSESFILDEFWKPHNKEQFMRTVCLKKSNTEWEVNVHFLNSALINFTV